MRADPAEYDFVSPGSLRAVLALLAEQPGRYTPMAGGTEVMVQFCAGRLGPRRLVNILGLPELTAITVTPDEITLGSGVTYTAIRSHPEVAAEFPLLARAAGWTGGVANQNRGTLGGNLVNASPAADSPPALLAYNAEVSLISARGTRRIAYDGFHTGYKQTALVPDELLFAVHLPRCAYTHQYLRKVGARNAQAISKVALAAVANLTGGIVTEARIALASVSHAPFRCRNTEAALLNSPANADLLPQARAALLAEIAPLDDIRSTARYRAHVSANLLEEFLTELIRTGAEGSHGPIVDSGVTALARFNGLAAPEAAAQLLACCGCRRWAEALVAQRPFRSTQGLLAAAEAGWFALSEPDWLEAFARHPRIGERRAPSTEYLAHSASEQAAAQQTLHEVADALLAGNRGYEYRFGFRYLVFANGRSASELLGILNERLTHTREEELQEAAHQQHRITTLRMAKWLEAET